MLLMVGKGIRGGTFHASQQFANSNQKYVKDYEKNEESLQFKCWDINDLYVLPISQKLPVIILSGSKLPLNLIKMLQKVLMKKVMKDIF